VTIPDQPVTLSWTLERDEWLEASRAVHGWRWWAPVAAHWAVGLPIAGVGIVFLALAAGDFTVASPALVMVWLGLVVVAMPLYQLRRAWARNGRIRWPTRATVSADGIHVQLDRVAPTRPSVHVGWHQLEPMVESRHMFAAHYVGTHRPRKLLCLPKRGLTDPARLDDLRALLRLAGRPQPPPADPG
jgi:hypothetical protein